MTSRLLSVFPPSLWDAAKDVLTLPQALGDCYVARIDRLALRELAAERSDKRGAIGGAGRTETDRHFAQNFDGSAARAQLAVLDPKHELGPTSDHFIAAAAGETLALTDAPCGAGAAALAFLANIAALRKAKVLPREPLDVTLIGGEHAPEAIEHVEALLACLQPSLEEQAVFVAAKFLEWDVTDGPSTVDLIKCCVRHSTNDQRKLLIVANFSGFLSGPGKYADSKAQLRQLFEFAGGDLSRAVWIEPKMNQATGSGGVFEWLLKKLFAGSGRQMRPAATAFELEPVFTAEAKFARALAPGAAATVRCAVMPIDLRVDPP